MSAPKGKYAWTVKVGEKISFSIFGELMDGTVEQGSKGLSVRGDDGKLYQIGMVKNPVDSNGNSLQLQSGNQRLGPNERFVRARHCYRDFAQAES